MVRSILKRGVERRDAPLRAATSDGHEGPAEAQAGTSADAAWRGHDRGDEPPKRDRTSGRQGGRPTQPDAAASGGPEQAAETASKSAGGGTGGGIGGGVVADPPAPRSVTKRTGASYRSTVHPIKQHVNDWLCTLAGKTWIAAGADHPRPRALVLETGARVTVRALLAHGTCPAEAVFVPQPNAKEARLLRASGVQVFSETSHQFLQRYAREQPGTSAAGRDKARTETTSPTGGAAPLGTVPGCQAPGHGPPERFSFVFLDYCGTLTSKVGRQRQADLMQLLRDDLLQDGALVAVTLAARGAMESYRGEVADRVAVLVHLLADEHGGIMHLLGVIGYSISSQMYTVAFRFFRRASSRAEHCALADSAIDPMEGVAFRRGLVQDPLQATTRAYAGLADVAAKFCSRAKAEVHAVRHALVLDSVLGPVSQQLEGMCIDTCTLMADPLDAALTRRHGVLTGPVATASVRDHLAARGESQAARGLAAGVGGSAVYWLCYFGARAMTGEQLRGCHSWSDINAVFSHLGAGALGGRGLVGVLVPYDREWEYWQGCAVDHTLAGMQRAAERHGCCVGDAGAYLTQRPQPLLVIICHVVCKHDDEACRSQPEPVVLTKSAPAVAAPERDGAEAAAWAEFPAWDMSRPKVPTDLCRRFGALSDFIVAAARHALRGAVEPTRPLDQAAAAGVLVHEPGFHHVGPALRRALPSHAVGYLCGDDSVLLAEAARTGARVAPHAGALDASAAAPMLVLLHTGGWAGLRRTWEATLSEWLRCRGVFAASPDQDGAAEGPPHYPVVRMLALHFTAPVDDDVARATAWLQSAASGHGLRCRLDSVGTVLQNAQRSVFTLHLLTAAGGDGHPMRDQALCWRKVRPRHNIVQPAANECSV